jgi:hypothetical protein
MSEPKATIVLAGVNYPVRPLTLKQIRDIFPVLSGLRGIDLNNPESINTLVGAVSTALMRDHQELTPEFILDQEVTVAELTSALRGVGSLAGLKYRDEQAQLPGEAPAATENE